MVYLWGFPICLRVFQISRRTATPSVQSSQTLPKLFAGDGTPSVLHRQGQQCKTLMLKTGLPIQQQL
jgi:hypothetical protein